MSQHRDWGQVAVLSGGMTERDVSLESGRLSHEALQQLGVSSVLLQVVAEGDVAQDVRAQLTAVQPDRVFIALHGGDGENGVVQAVCEDMGLPYTGSGVAASALARDKLRSKRVWQAVGLPVLPYVLLDLTEPLLPQVSHWSFPLAVKPVDGGSSLGVSCVTSADMLDEAVRQAKQYDTQVLAEPWVKGRELTMGFLGDAPLPLLEIKPADGFYDYTAKYLSDHTTYPVVMEPAEQVQTIRAICQRAYHVLGCYGWGRVDGLLDAAGAFYLLEVNTVPGLSSHSLVPKAAAVLGWDFSAVIESILSTSWVSRTVEQEAL